jgi:ferredoxin-NADP reductase
MKPYVHHQHNMSLEVLSTRQESASYWSCVFRRPPGFTFASGDWIDLCFGRSPGTPVKTFSFSSGQNEADIMITYKIGISPFKQQLHRLRPGDKIDVYQYGNSGFGLDSAYDAVMIAGGIGIAPFRSMLIDATPAQNITLFYQSRSDDFAFKAEIDAWAHHHPYHTVIYIDSSLKGRLKQAMINEYVRDMTVPKFYIAGPPGMVETTEQFLLSQGVKAHDILDDEFTGY